MMKLKPMQKHSIFLLFIGALFLLSGCSSSKGEKTTFSNPILSEGPDPFVYQHTDGFYYCMVTRGDRLTLWKTNDFTDLKDKQHSDIWFPPDKGPNSSNIWAPEIHYLDGDWYIYYTATDRAEPTDNNRGVFVLRNQTENPLNDNWDDLGQLKTPLPGIDGSVFEFRNNRYFLYSPYVDNQSGIMIARMKSPFELETPASLLGLPMHDWEKTDDREIMEGPQFLEGPGNKVFIIYSAGACWDNNYGLGILTANKDADLLDHRSWSRSSKQVFGFSEKNSVYGPGHNCFTQSPSGNEDWIVYHAKPAASDQCSNRSTRAQQFSWDKNGEPVFGIPYALDNKLKAPR